MSQHEEREDNAEHEEHSTIDHCFGALGFILDAL